MLGIILICIVLALSSVGNAATTRTWELEDYNDWNLPFALTVEIEGNAECVASPCSHNEHSAEMSKYTYKMEVDASALFTVLWMDESAYDWPETDDGLKNLNFTFLGDVP